VSVIINVKCLTKNLIENWRYKILSQIFTITYHDHISYVVLFKLLRLVKMLSGNNYTILHAMPPIVDDAKKYAIILSDVVINM